MPPVTRSKHAYPPRPVPLDQDWETVDASSIPADAASEGNTGNPKSHVAGTTTIPPATKLGERVDNGTEHADTTEQVELRALSQPAVEDESILLSAANLRAPSRKPSTPSLSQKPLTASTPRHAPSSTEKARSTAPSQSVSRVPSSARLSASSRSSIRDRLRAPAALLKAPVPKPPQSTRRPGRQSANRKTEAPAVEDTAIAAVIVGGHALRKRPISPERLVETTHMQSAAKAGTKPKTRRRRPVPRAATPANHPASATDAATTLPTRVSKRAKRV
ncbi:hypothetical protein EC988_000187 [Linderina pennispora]|nr:hypothetical protein EC988_000187 [Linderina pennispora]